LVTPRTPPSFATSSAKAIRRFFVQHFGRTANGVEDQAAISIATFDGKPVSGDVCQLETATLPDRDPDDRGVLFTTHTYRY
jgi:hypothetical protein